MSTKFITVVSIGEEDKTNLAFVRYESISIIEQNENPLLVTIWTPVDGVLVGDATMFKNRLDAIYAVLEHLESLQATLTSVKATPEGNTTYIENQITAQNTMLDTLLEPHQHLEQVEQYVGVYFTEDEATEYGLREDYTQHVSEGDAQAKKLRSYL